MQRADKCKTSTNFKAPSWGGDPSHSPLRALSAPIVPASASLSDCLNVDRKGYIKIHRILSEHPIKTDPNALLVFLDLLINAEWKDGSQKFFKGRQVTLKRGQLTCGRKQLSYNTGIKPSTVRDALKRLSTKYQICDIEPDMEYSLITILNYDRYQNFNSEPDIEPDSTPTAPRQHPDTLEEVKHTRTKEYIRDIGSRPPSPTDQDFIISLKNNPAYQNINIDIELSKMDAWLSARPGRKKTRKFVVNWLNGIERSMLPTNNKTQERLLTCTVPGCKAKPMTQADYAKHRPECEERLKKESEGPMDPKIREMIDLATGNKK